MIDKRALIINGSLGFVFGLMALAGADRSFASAVQKPAEEAKDDDKDDTKELSPEEKMKRRYPQPVRAGFLVGLPVLDDNDSTIGFVTKVVRSADGKIQLIVPYGGWFGRGGRPVAVPLEAVAILARQIAALDMPRDDFDDAPTWEQSQGTPLAPDEMIKIAITRR